jgi:hypothetical protein
MYSDNHNEDDNPDDCDDRKHEPKNETDVIISITGLAIGFLCIYGGFLFTLFSNANPGELIYESGVPLMVIGSILIVVIFLKKHHHQRIEK